MSSLPDQLRRIEPVLASLVYRAPERRGGE